MFKVYRNANDLPTVWDEITKDNHFMKREILKKLEVLNPCRQQYHLNEAKKIAIVSYELNLDLFTFSRYLSFKVPIKIIGIPLSVSSCGYVIGNQENMKDFYQHIKTLKGLYLILNSKDEWKLARGNTLSNYKIKIRWSKLDDYVDSMRSHYRYRLKKAIKKFTHVKMEVLEDNSLFDKDLYGLYEEVYNRSNEKLEKLSIDFFRSFPSKIIKFTVNKEAIAFVQLVEHNQELTFLFGGFKHQLNATYDLYINMLLEIIRYGIEKGFQSIDLGQTAEETKSKLGAEKHPRYMYLHHSNFLINFVFNRLINRFSYKDYGVDHHVFKGEEDEGSAGEMS